MGQPLAEVWKHLAAKPSPVAFPIPTGSCHRRLLITRSQFLPGSWTEPRHPAGVRERVLHYPSHDPAPGDQCVERRQRSHHPLFLLLGLRVEVVKLGAASGPTWGTMAVPYTLQQRDSPPPPRQHAQQSFGSPVVLPNLKWGQGTQARALQSAESGREVCPATARRSRTSGAPVLRMPVSGGRPGASD